MPKQAAMKWTDFRVGLLVVASIAILIVLILAVSGDLSLFTSEKTYYTELAGAEGLRAGDEVRLAGVRVGSVKDVEFTDVPLDKTARSSVRVEMVIEGEEAHERIREDSRAVLRQLGLLGGQYVNITPGTKESPILPEGRTISGLKEVSISEVVESSDDVLAGFKQLTNKLNEITETINSGRGSIGRFINDESFYLNLNKVTLEAQELVRRIREGEGTAGKLINDPELYDDIRAAVNELQTVANQVSSGQGTIGKLIKEEEVYARINSAAARLDAASERVENITKQVQSGQGTIGKLVYDEKLHQDASAAVASLKSITDRIDRGEGTLGKLAKDDALYNNLNALSSESVKLLYDFRQNPKKYLSVKVSLF